MILGVGIINAKISVSITGWNIESMYSSEADKAEYGEKKTWILEISVLRKMWDVLLSGVIDFFARRLLFKRVRFFRLVCFLNLYSLFQAILHFYVYFCIVKTSRSD